jgi:cell division septal protein FtsQ
MNRRLILIVGIFGFIAFLIVLSSAVFSLKTAQLNFLSTTNHLQEEQEILDSANFDYGQSVFFLDREVYIKNLEQQNPYLKVIGLEVVFPNKVVVHAVERNEVYAFKLSNNTYAITDEELKVLEIRPVFVNATNNAMEVSLYNGQIEASSARAGETLLLNSNDALLLKNFFTYSSQWEVQLANLRANIKIVTLHYEEANMLHIEMRQGVQIIVPKATDQLSDKLQLGYSVYESDEINRARGIILIVKQQNEQLVVMYDEGL